MATLLNEAAADGRLTLGEHSERVERAYAARTLGELAPLTADLTTAAGQPIQLDGRRLVAGIFSREYREGRWVVPDRLAVSAVFGEVTLDLREAVLQSPRVLVFATVVAGTLRLIVPEDVIVEVTGAAVLGRKGSGTSRRDGPAAEPGSPVIDVRAFALGGRVKVVRPRRPRWSGRRRPGQPPRR